MASPKSKNPKRTAKYYAEHPKAKAKKAAYDKKYNRKIEQRKKRSQLASKNRASDKRGVNREGKDFDHATNRYVKSSTNRGRTSSKNGSKDGNARGKK